MHRPAQLNFPLRREGRAALRELRGDDAVEHVNTAMDGLEQIDGCADTHEVAR